MHKKINTKLGYFMAPKMCHFGLANGFLLSEVSIPDNKRNVVAFQALEDKAYVSQFNRVAVLAYNLDEFLDNTLFVPGYIQDECAMMYFILSIASSEVAKKYPNGLIFHINTSELDFCSNMFLLDVLKKHDYRSLIIRKKGVPEFKLDLTYSSTRDLIILIGWKLSENDYGNLYKMAQVFAGCSGDNTLNMTLSNGLIPFYDKRKWKKDFVREFFHFLVMFRQKHPEVRDEYISAIINLPYYYGVGGDFFPYLAQTEQLASKITLKATRSSQAIIQYIQRELDFRETLRRIALSEPCFRNSTCLIL